MSLPIGLAPEYREHFERHAGVIRARLEEFAAVPPDEYLFELFFCLLTPGSRAAHAEAVMAELRRAGFPERDVDPTPYLRDPRHYIRFHNQKARRLVSVASRRDTIRRMLADPEMDERARRAWLVENVDGLGWKEASHFLRNIGARGLAIIDRHVLKHLVRCNVLAEIPTAITGRRYLELEAAFIALAERAGLALQELDLLFWSMEEGSVRK